METTNAGQDASGPRDLLRQFERCGQLTFAAAYKAFESDLSRLQQLSAFEIMATLLEHADMMRDAKDRVYAIFILYKSHAAHPLTENPFLHTLLQCYTAPDRSLHDLAPSQRHAPTFAERKLLFHIFSTTVEQIAPETTVIGDFALEKNKTPHAHLPPIDLSPFEAALPKVPKASAVHRAPDLGIPLPENMSNNPDEHSSDGLAEALRLLGDMPLSFDLPAPLLLPPPTLPITNNELIWINPSVFDYQLQFDTYLGDIVEPLPQDIINSSVEGPLAPHIVDRLKVSLEESPDLILSLEFSAAMLPAIVKHNPHVATLLLTQKLQRGQRAGMTEYFSVIVGMDMTLNSMEVVNKLTSTCNLPEEFVHMYISNCIKTCEKNKEQSPNFLRRLVRLVCVFLQSLIRNKIIDLHTCSKDLVVEVQCFCIEFSKYKEAAGLFRLLRTFDVHLEGDRKKGLTQE